MGAGQAYQGEVLNIVTLFSIGYLLYSLIVIEISAPYLVTSLVIIHQIQKESLGSSLQTVQC